MNEPLISVITPFRNTAPYLAQCIESVLAQSCSRFEYILSDNCSEDGSGEIAEAYARRDSRIHLIRQGRLLPQAQHYNAVLAEISKASQYCKIVQADDCIFPECLRLMMQAFDQSDSIGLVSSYYLKGSTVLASGFPYWTSLLNGKEMARLNLRTGLFVFGSESTVMYRASLVRSCQPFFQESLLHADTEKCLQILEDWDFGFIHQVLSFLRTDNVNETISGGLRTFQPEALDRYITVQRYASRFLEAAEAVALKNQVKREYYDFLAREAVRFREPTFWQYHQEGLATLGEALDRVYLRLRIGRELFRLAANPGMTSGRALSYLWRRLRLKDVPGAPSPHQALPGSGRPENAFTQASPSGILSPLARAGIDRHPIV